MDYSVEDTSIRVGLHLYPTSHSILPYSVCYQRIHVIQDMDCVLMCHAMNEGEQKEDRLLILSSTLQLRGIISISHIIDCFITRYGIFVLQNTETSSRLIKYDFCGIQISTCELKHTWWEMEWRIMNSYCGTVNQAKDVLVLCRRVILIWIDRWLWRYLLVGGCNSQWSEYLYLNWKDDSADCIWSNRYCSV